MHHVCDFIGADDIALGVEATCKKQVLLAAARMLARSAGISEMTIFLALEGREALGSTGFGGGTAAPHARLPELEKTHAAFLQLNHPVEFEATDDEPVDLVCAIIGPNGATTEPFEALVSACRALRDREASEKLRQSGNATAFRVVLAEASCAGSIHVGPRHPG